MAVSVNQYLLSFYRNSSAHIALTSTRKSEPIWVAGRVIRDRTVGHSLCSEADTSVKQDERAPELGHREVVVGVGEDLNLA